MTKLAEIEAAIEQLPRNDLDELASWLEAYRSRPTASSSFEQWLSKATGAARPGVTTDEIMALTRGE